MFLYILAAVEIIWSVTSFFWPEKYMKWYYRQGSKDYKAYDANIFKISHSLALLAIGILTIIIKLTDYKHYGIVLLIMAAVIVVYYFVIFKLAKKDRQ